MKHRVRAAGLFIDNERILLVLHRHPEGGSEWWIPPGGGLQEDDDSVFHTAQREIFEETGLRACLSKISYIREFREASTNTYHLEFFMPVDSYTGEITIENIPPGDLDDGLIQRVEWLHRSKLKNKTVWPEWIYEDWFWRDAGAEFPETRYMGVGMEKNEIQEEKRPKK